MNGAVQKREESIKGDTLSCRYCRGMTNQGPNKERVMGAARRATILGETRNAPLDLTLFGRGPRKVGRKESGKGEKG